MARSRLSLIWWLALPVALLVAGAANYFLAGPSSGEKPAEAVVQFSADSHTARPTRSLLFDLPVASSRITTDSVVAFEAVRPGPDGSIMVVDHPAQVIGARVRWYSEKGKLLATEYTPAGSTLFMPDGQGLDFSYIMARQAGPSEKLVVRASGRETTYTVPMGLNAGSIVRVGDTTYVSVLTGSTDVENATTDIQSRLLPVYRDDRQLSDSQAAELGLDATLLGEDLKLYQYRQQGEGFGSDEVLETRIRRVSDQALLRIPDAARVLGVDRAGRLWLWIDPVTLDRRWRFLSAWPSSRSPEAEVLVAEFDGDIVARLAIPASPRLASSREPAAIDANGMIAATLSGDTLSLWRYEVETR